MSETLPCFCSNGVRPSVDSINPINMASIGPSGLAIISSSHVGSTASGALVHMYIASGSWTHRADTIYTATSLVYSKTFGKTRRVKSPTRRARSATRSAQISHRNPHILIVNRVMHRNILLDATLAIVVLTTTSCSSFPDACSQGVPTVKNCFSLQGMKGAYSFGPINIVNSKF